jgi:predicted MFS family arabinose efflux permease
VAPPLVTAIIAEWGWRAAYLAISAGILLIAVPVVWLLFRDREAPPAHEAAMLAAGATARQAFASYRFYILFIVFGAITFGVGGIIPNLVPLLTDRGLEPAQAAGYASMAGLAVILGRVIAGFLLDRFWAPGVAFVFLAVPAVSCFILAAPGLPAPLLIGVAAALVGLAAGAEFDLIAFMVSRYFGMRNYGLLYSIQVVALLFAGGLAPPLFGRIYDVTGSYNVILYVCAGLFIVSPLLLLLLGRYPTYESGAAPGEAPPAPSAAPAV